MVKVFSVRNLLLSSHFHNTLSFCLVDKHYYDSHKLGQEQKQERKITAELLPRETEFTPKVTINLSLGLTLVQ